LGAADEGAKKEEAQGRNNEEMGLLQKKIRVLGKEDLIEEALTLGNRGKRSPRGDQLS